MFKRGDIEARRCIVRQLTQNVKCQYDCRIQYEETSAFNAIQAQRVLQRPFCLVMKT